MDSRALAGTAAALGAAAGLGIGYALFHGGGGSKTTTPAVPAAATSAASSSSAGDFSLDGTLTLKFVDGSFLWNRGDTTNPCAGHGGYDDITQGASVTITDQAGTVIATGSLDAGSATLDSGGRAAACVFTFAVSHVPDGRTFYGVAVSHRGIVQFSADQAKGGQASLSLG